VSQDNIQEKDGIADGVFADVKVAKALGRHGVSPVNATLVIVEQG
jgi:hypothetical protein